MTRYRRGNFNVIPRRPSQEGLPPMGLAARVVLSEIEQRCRRHGPWTVSLRELARQLEERSHTTVSRAVQALQRAELITYTGGTFRLTGRLVRALAGQEDPSATPDPDPAPAHEAPGNPKGLLHQSTAPRILITSDDDVTEKLPLGGTVYIRERAKQNSAPVVPGREGGELQNPRTRELVFFSSSFRRGGYATKKSRDPLLRMYPDRGD